MIKGSVHQADWTSSQVYASCYRTLKCMKQKEIGLQREIKKKKKKNTSKQYVGLKRKFQGKLEKKICWMKIKLQHASICKM